MLVDAGLGHRVGERLLRCAQAHRENASLARDRITFGQQRIRGFIGMDDTQIGIDQDDGCRNRIERRLERAGGYGPDVEDPADADGTLETLSGVISGR